MLNPDNRDPYDIKGVDYRTVASLEEMESLAASILSDRPFPKGPSLPAYLLEPMTDERRWLLDNVSGPCAVSITRFSGMLSELWDLFGDGRETASDVQSRAACRKAYQAAFGKRPSARALDLALDAAQRAIAHGDNGRLTGLAGDPSLPESVSRPARMVLEYEKELDRVGLVDRCRAARLAASGFSKPGAPRLTVVSANPPEGDIAQPAFFKACVGAVNVDLHVIREISSAEAALSALDGIDARFAASLGAHAVPSLLADVIEDLAATGAKYEDVLVAVPNEEQAVNELSGTLTGRGIPFECTYPNPISRTPLGRWVYDAVSLMSWREGSPDGEMGEDALRSLGYFATSPYTGAEGHVAEAREAVRQAIGAPGDPLCPDEALDELPFKALAVTSALSHGAGAGVEGLERAVGELFRVASPDGEGAWEDNEDGVVHSVSAYFDEMAKAGWEPDVEDLETLAVRLDRSFDPAGAPAQGRVRIVSLSLAPYEEARHVIVYGMDAASVSFYQAPNAFGRFLSALGCEPDPWAPERAARAQLRDAIDKARGGTITFMRSCHSKDGSELPPSPFYSEFAERWGGLGDDGMPKDLPDDKKQSLSEAELRDRAIEAAEFSYASVNGARNEDGDPMECAAEPLHVFSPTDLELYWQCPHKWLVDRNGSGYPEKREAGILDASVQGNIVHQALKGYYDAFGKEHPRQDPHADPARSALHQAFDEAVRRKAPWIGDEPSPDEELQLDWLYGCVEGVVERDREFLPGFAPASFEERFFAKLGGMPVEGTIDRIDVRQGDDGRRKAVVIDYKGSVDREYAWKKPRRKDEGIGEPGLHVQGLIYAMLVEGRYPDVDVVGIVYRGYKTGEDIGISTVPLSTGEKAPTSPEDYAGYRQTFAGMLEGMAKGLLGGHYPMRPRRNQVGVCSFCPISASCPSKVGR